MDSTAGSEATTSAIPPLKLRAVTPGFRASSSGRDITQTLELYADRPAAIDWPRTTNAWRVLIKQFDDELRLAMKVEPDEFVAAFSDVNAMGDECIAIIMAVAEAVFGIKRSSQAASTTVQERGAKARRVRSSELLIMYREQVRKHKRVATDFVGCLRLILTCGLPGTDGGLPDIDINMLCSCVTDGGLPEIDADMSAA